MLESPSSIAMAWNHFLNGVWIAETAIDLSFPALLLLSGWGNRMASTSERWAKGNRTLALVIFALTYLLIRFVLRLPVEFARHAEYPGSSPDSMAEWLAGQVQSLIVPVLAIVLLIWLPLFLIRKSPRHWWLWLTAISAPIALVVLIAQPLWVSAGGDFRSLGNGPLKTTIVAMASECGISHIPVVMGGRDTTVVGLGPTNRVILQSDLFKAETPAQIRFTVAHELKHYVLGDNWKALLIVVMLVLAASWLVHVSARWAFRKDALRMRGRDLSDIRAFPYIVLCVVILWIVAAPGFLALNRHIESEADRFGLELSHENAAASDLFQSWLGELDVADPGWFARLTRITHPSVAERIQLARDYRPWETGAPLAYGDVCRMSAK